MKLEKNFKLSEFTYSPTAVKHNIPNTPSKLVVARLKLLCEQILQPLRESVLKPIKISSGYRCLKVNEMVGGVPSSQHTLGQAADIVINGMTPYEIGKKVIELNLPFDQLIFYETFVHISYSPRHRRQILYNKSYRGKRIS